MRAWLVWRLALVLYAISFVGFAVAIAFIKSDSNWVALLLYAAGAAFLVAVFVTLFGISLIGDRPKR